MVKSCRKYWTKEIADSIHQLKDVRFINPQMNVWTTFDRDDFTKILVEDFKVDRAKVEAFYDHLRKMNFYDDNTQTTGEMFEEFFPGRTDVHRLLMEPISYANGSHIDDPAITYGIVFSNFMSKGVFTFQGGTDTLIKKMVAELQKNGCEVRKCALVDGIDVEDGKVVGIRARSQNTGGESFPVRHIKCKAVLSNANVRNTIEYLVGEDKFDADFVAEAKAVRNNTSSCQVYMGIKKGETIPNIGDLVFTSKAPEYTIDELTSIKTSSHTFSVYYPETRPHLKESRYTVVASLNARWAEWNDLSEEEYERREAAHLRRVRHQPRDLYSGRSRQDRSHRGGHPTDGEPLHEVDAGHLVRNQVRGAQGLDGALRADRRALSCGLGRHHHVRLARHDELRRDHREQAG